MIYFTQQLRILHLRISRLHTQETVIDIALQCVIIELKSYQQRPEMNIINTIGKKLAFFSVAATLALTASQAQSVTVTGVDLTGQNYTQGCVRFFVNGQHYDVSAGQSTKVFYVASGSKFMASVFPSGGVCGGTATRNVW
ncbi:hypothetical protein MX031_21630, partial [Ralstonia solanacearum]|uniref:hypothetical protein n=1 Tax=Ralstonia solanacearum TaxID=305 RepID=UPI0020347682|nr:hypothetical protein [Ralstonia solanacearum]